MKAAMAGTGGAGDSRRWTMLDKSLRETRSDGRGVMATGGALARHRGVLVSAGGDVRPPDKSATTKVATDASGTCERRDGGETQSGDMVAGLHARWRRHAVAVRCCVGSMRKGLLR